MVVINRAAGIELPTSHLDLTQRPLQVETRSSDSDLSKATKLNLSDLADVHMDVLCRLQTIFQYNNEESMWLGQYFSFTFLRFTTLNSPKLN